ncbi:SPOSA6832_01288 [Sporobolomyces salmonicolor]|uniref:SPOSA6832_01288-mRNA-1:cds n=1 Tax=Sporidiobolus salmonicolor TaxID=5005 RepID=A0A0D6EIE7_SPOSA|nr:SPOSA6832_01288 [Sporobolomyces salmonicolor]
MSLQEAADARKAKLAALKKRKTLHDTGAPQDRDANGADKSAVFKFRNYDPETGTLRKHARTDEDDTVEKQVEGLADQVIAQDEHVRAQDLDLTNIQPKKANWDLKRDLERKARCIFTSRKRLQAQKGVSETAGAELVAGMDKAGPEADAADSDEED